jgi:hypothetical protein
MTSVNGRDPAIEHALKLLPATAAAAARAIIEDGVEQPPPASWQVFTLADAYLERPPRQYVIDGLLKLPSLNIVYGAPGCLKTMLLIDLAACVANGEPWLMPLPGKRCESVWAVTKAPVLWVDCDNGADDMHERLAAIGRGHNMAQADPLYYVSMPDPWLDASDAAGPSFTELRSKAETYGVKLIVIDNLAVVSGNADENSVDMTKVLSAFRKLSEDLGAAIILIHHQRKSQGVKTRAGDSLRGHSSIEAALNLALLIEREEHASNITARATKVRGVDIMPFGAMFTFEHKSECDELHSARFYGVEIEDTTSNTAIERLVLETVHAQQPVKKQIIVDTVKEQLPDIGINRIRNEIDNLTQAGKLTVRDGAHTSKLYSLPAGVVVNLMDTMYN